jgi:RNA-binding protein Tab2/Atab2
MRTSRNLHSSIPSSVLRLVWISLLGFCDLTIGFISPVSYHIVPTLESQSRLQQQETDFAEGFVRTVNVPPSPEWELDCYSRPVMIGGKKLWEILMTDSTGSFRFCKTLPSNQVNSREVRRVVEQAIEESDIKPQTIRFFRGAMFNMINIALSEVDVVAKPSRCTFQLASWLEERHRYVYPTMDG